MGKMTDELDAFDRAMRVAETHRRCLRDRYGLSDAQIGQLTLARRRTPRSVMGQYAAAVVTAKRRLEERHGKEANA
jgi:hypothetical protein